MTSDNVFSDWQTSLEKFFDIRWIPGFINPRIIYLPRPTGLGKYNVPG